MAVSRKQGDPPSLLYSMVNEIYEPQIIMYGQLLLSLIIIFFVVKQKKTNYVLIVVSLLISWFFAYYGKMESYWLYPISFAYLGTTVLLADDKYRHKFFIVLVYGVIVFTNFSIRWKDFILYQNRSFYSYDVFSDKILESIPDNTAVFVSSIPDPYFAFKKYNRKNDLYMPPAFNIKREDYLKILNDTDYIIYTWDYSGIVHGDFLRRYIEQNVESEYDIGSYKQYEAQIFKLKDKNLRTKP